MDIQWEWKMQLHKLHKYERQNFERENKHNTTRKMKYLMPYFIKGPRPCATYLLDALLMNM